VSGQLDGWVVVIVGQPVRMGRPGVQVVVSARGADGALRSAQSRASRRSIVLTTLRAIPPTSGAMWPAQFS
jgi:hypothetical protein